MLGGYGMIEISKSCNFEKTIAHLEKMRNAAKKEILNKYGKMGVDALRAATPVDTGKTAASWSYKIQNTGSGVEIIWSNSNVNKGENIAILIQYGHGTRNGGYVRGVDYINPAMKPIFENLAKELEREVSSI